MIGEILATCSGVRFSSARSLLLHLRADPLGTMQFKEMMPGV